MPSTSSTTIQTILPISGAVLAGGRSRRFGQDKATYIYKGKQMLDWSLDSLSKTSERFIIANQGYKTNFPIHKDIRTKCTETGCGPLGGLHAALTHAKHEWVALAACDMPNLSSTYWQILFEQTKTVKHAVVVRGTDNRLQTLAALYNQSLLPVIETHLDNNTLALQSLSNYFSVVEFNSLSKDKTLRDDLFLNFNYLEDAQ